MVVRPGLGELLRPSGWHPTPDGFAATIATGERAGRVVTLVPMDDAVQLRTPLSCPTHHVPQPSLNGFLLPGSSGEPLLVQVIAWDEIASVDRCAIDLAITAATLDRSVEPPDPQPPGD